MKLKSLKISLFLSILFIFANFSFVSASNMTGIDVNLKVGSTCNNNNVCDSGEDMHNCPADCLPEPSPTGRTTTGTITQFFNDLSVEVGYDYAIIKWESNMPTNSILKWGTNNDYKDGVIKNVELLTKHSALISNLQNRTTYYFSIYSENYYGTSATLDNQFFQTLSLPDRTPPSNPINVSIASIPTGIALSWVNPSDLDFSYIRIMRTEDRYYADPFTGKIVYEGAGNYFLDTNVIEGHKYFYVLFARDKTGNYSSGSLISIIHNPKGLDNIGQEIPPIENEIPLPSNFYFKVIQNSLNYDFAPGDNFKLSGDEPIIISTNYFSKIKNDDLWVEIRNSNGIIIGQYFFSRTRDSNTFISVVLPIFTKGDYYHVAIYKYNYGVSQLVNHGWFDISKVSSLERRVWSLRFVFVIFIILILVVLVLFKILRRCKKEKIVIDTKEKDSKSLDS